jgi:hypothetical protein
VEREANSAGGALYVDLLVIICGIAIAPGAGLIYEDARLVRRDSFICVDGAEEDMMRNEDSG